MALKTKAKVLPWLLHTWKGYRFQACLNAGLGIFLVMLDLAFVWCTKMSVDIATGANKSIPLSTSLLFLSSIVVAQIITGLTSRRIRATLGAKSQNRMQLSLFRKLLSSKWQDLRAFHTGDLLNRIEQDVKDVVIFLTENIPSFVTTCVQLIGAFLLLFSMDKTLACLILTIVPLFLLCSKLYFKKMRSLTHDIRSSESKMQSVIQESLQHALIIKTLERISFASSKLSDLQKDYRGKVIKKANYSIFSIGIVNTGFAIGYLSTFIWGIVNLESGAITYGTLLAFIQLVGQIQGPARTLTKFVPVFIGAFTASDRLIELYNLHNEDKSKQMRLRGEVGIRLDGITFSYQDDSKDIMNNFSCDFKPGSITAIIGETGTGKTTLIRILLSLTRSVKSGKAVIYSSRENTIYPISANTRCNFSYVPQGNTLISGTIRENLLMGNPKAQEDELKRALLISEAGFVFNLPRGMDTPCGEMGGGLSEGQAQRVAIARALLKDSPVLLLDEATSSLDEDTEKKVIKNIAEECGGKRTIICVTHRPEILKYSSDVVRL